MKHHCHAIGCEKPTNRKMLMCSIHWTMVPTALQVPVRTHFHSEQCGGKRRPSKEWLKAARAAITYVAHQEGKLSIARELGSEGESSK